MFSFLEGKYEPLAPLRVFYNRLVQCFLLTLVIVGFSLVLGTVGYHYSEGLSWLDSLVNAAMILTGMGPTSPMTSVPGKLFSVFYCLYSGLAFLSLVAILVTPICHRFVHQFHLSEECQPQAPPPRPEPPTLGTEL